MLLPYLFRNNKFVKGPVLKKGDKLCLSSSDSSGALGSEDSKSGNRFLNGFATFVTFSEVC